VNQPLWSAVDDYWTTKLHAPDDTLAAAAADSAAGGLPPIAVTAPMGKFLHLLARAQGARRILEIGTLGGYSTIWLARALPSDGELVTCEIGAAQDIPKEHEGFVTLIALNLAQALVIRMTEGTGRIKS